MDWGFPALVTQQGRAVGDPGVWQSWLLVTSFSARADPSNFSFQRSLQNTELSTELMYLLITVWFKS